jgi:hypothetical protein
MTDHDIAELLPFYANGTLDAGDRARVEAELATCAACAAELHDLETLAASLKARAQGTPPFPSHVLDDVMARIAAPPATAAGRLSAAWWAAPARYATAATLVVGIGAAGMAAWHLREADLARSTQGTAASSHDTATTTIFRVSPGASRAPENIPYSDSVPPAAAKRASENALAAPPAQAKQHRLARKAQLDLLVRDVEASLKQAQSAVRTAGGEVTALADASPRTEGAVHDATLQVEVPADRLENTLDHLAQLGTVQNRAIDAADVDAAIVDQEARLRNLRRAEIDLRKLMDKGGKVTDILTVQQNLSEVRGQIEQLDAQHKHDLHRVGTSTIAVTLTEDRPNPTPAKPGPTARIDGAWHSGLNALADTTIASLTAIVWCVAYAPVFLSLAAVGYAATRFLRKRLAST